MKTIITNEQIIEIATLYKGGMKQREISEKLNMPGSTVPALLSQLRRNGANLPKNPPKRDWAAIVAVINH